MPEKGRPEAEADSGEKFKSNVDHLINELLEHGIQKIGKPVVHITKEDKLEIIRDLKENGLFLIKGSAKEGIVGVERLIGDHL